MKFGVKRCHLQQPELKWSALHFGYHVPAEWLATVILAVINACPLSLSLSLRALSRYGSSAPLMSSFWRKWSRTSRSWTDWRTRRTTRETPKHFWSCPRQQSRRRVAFVASRAASASRPHRRSSSMRSNRRTVVAAAVAVPAGTATTARAATLKQLCPAERWWSSAVVIHCRSTRSRHCQPPLTQGGTCQSWAPGTDMHCSAPATSHWTGRREMAKRSASGGQCGVWAVSPRAATPPARRGHRRRGELITRPTTQPSAPSTDMQTPAPEVSWATAGGRWKRQVTERESALRQHFLTVQSSLFHSLFPLRIQVQAQKLFIIVVFFMICWLPLYTSNTVQVCFSLEVQKLWLTWVLFVFFFPCRQSATTVRRPPTPGWTSSSFCRISTLPVRPSSTHFTWRTSARHYVDSSARGPSISTNCAT